MPLSKCAVYGSKNLTFIKQQAARALQSELTGMKVSILSNLTKSNILFENFKLNAIVKKILLAGDKFMREMHSRQQRFT